MHELYLNMLFSLKINMLILKYGSEQLFKFIGNLQANIQIYSVVQKSTNEYSNIYVLEKWDKYEHE